MHGEPPKLLRPKTKGGNVRTILIGTIIVVGAGALIYHFSGTSAPQRTSRFAANGGPVPVLAAAAVNKDVPVYLDAVGTIKANNTVTVSPQVDGKLLSVNFKEGQDVKKGDVLARIDPAIYQAQLDQAVAKKAQDDAQLANAKVDLDRYEKLAATNAINHQQADTQRALVAQYSALVQADQAAIENAQTTLNYTSIVAPIDGRTGIRQVDEGNIVHASSSPTIVVITQIQPITVIFNLPQQNIPQVTTAFAKGPLPVDALKSDDNSVLDRGTLTVVDNQVDPTTGTVKFKAEFPNANVQLWPGQFVNVQMLIDTLKGVVVVPTSAVQRGPNGTFVYVVGANNVAVMTPVTVTMQDEIQSVISSGVTPPANVVTTGFAQLTDKSKVTVGSDTPPPATPPGTPARKGQKIGTKPPTGTKAAPPPVKQ
jgi:multidrug efflux system membrane fusion protein